MSQIILPTILIVAISIVLLSVGIFVKGRFVNSHVSGNRALRRRGIHCAQQQDREARRPNPHAVAERGSGGESGEA